MRKAITTCPFSLRIRTLLHRLLTVGAIFSCSIAVELVSADGMPERITSSATNMKLILVQGGAFAMGSPLNEPERVDNEDQHTVVLTHCPPTHGGFTK
jgi:formylglycine-generating enzyme required for sulfatase activity